MKSADKIKLALTDPNVQARRRKFKAFGKIFKCDPLTHINIFDGTYIADRDAGTPVKNCYYYYPSNVYNPQFIANHLVIELKTSCEQRYVTDGYSIIMYPLDQSVYDEKMEQKQIKNKNNPSNIDDIIEILDAIPDDDAQNFSI